MNANSNEKLSSRLETNTQSKRDIIMPTLALDEAIENNQPLKENTVDYVSIFKNKL